MYVRYTFLARLDDLGVAVARWRAESWRGPVALTHAHTHTTSCCTAFFDRHRDRGARRRARDGGPFRSGRCTDVSVGGTILRFA